MIDQEIRQRFDEMLPWYVNGTLEAESRRWFEAQLAAHPELGAELRWTESLQTRVRESVPEIPADLGFDTLMRRVRAERRAATPSLRERIGAFLDSFRMTPAFATAAAVIAIQAGVIGALLTQEGGVESEYSTFRSTGDGRIVTGPVLEVAFKADAREREIRQLLVRVGGTLAGGPGQLGNYLVYVPADRIAETARIFEADPTVEAVRVVDDPASGK